MKLRVRLLDDAGQIRVQEVDAPGRDAVAAVLGIGEARVLAVEALAGASLLTGGGSRAPADILPFCEALQQILAAGISISEALEALADDAGSGASTLASAVLARLRLGASPSQAFEQSGLQWPPLLLALLASAERTGTLPEALARFVAFRRASDALRAQLVNASVYPLVLLVLASAVLLFLLGFVVPRFAAALDDLAGDLPLGTRVLLMLGQTVSDQLGLVLTALGGALTLTVLALRRSGVRQRLVRTLALIPAVHAVMQAHERAQLYRVLGTLTRGGLPLLEALRIAGRTLPAASRARIETLQSAISEGVRPSQALQASGWVDAVAGRLVVAGERTGSLPETFERMADRAEQQVSRTMQRAAGIYGPVLMMGVAVIIGAVVVFMYWPLLQIFEAVNR